MILAPLKGSIMLRLLSLLVMVTALFASFHPASLEGRSFKLSGEFKPYPFYPPSSPMSAFNWVYKTANGSCYRLYGTTPSQKNVFGWKRVDVACDAPPKWLFYFIGDLDGDGDVRFDYITIAAKKEKRRIFRLLPVEPGSFFRYEDLGFYNFTLTPKAIHFTKGYIKYLGLRRSHDFKDLPKFQILHSFDEVREAGFDFAVDFASYRVLLYKIVQPSGANRIHFGDPQFVGESVIKIPVKVRVPEIGTADMAYYIAAFAVSKSTQKVVFDYGERVDVAMMQQVASCEGEPKAPVCGLKRIACITTPCEPRIQTYPNYCALKADSQAEFLHYGACDKAKETNSSKMADSLYSFGVKLARKLYEGENLLISPLSIAGVLDMLYIGAAGATKEQLGDVLGDGEIDLITSYSKLQRTLHPKEATLLVANGAWVENRFHLFKSYRYLVEDLLDTVIKDANFLHQSEQVRQEINRWVEQKTHQKIKDLLPQGTVKEDTRVVLVNALYFYGMWQREFNEAKTTKEPFHLANQETIELAMMRQEGEYNMTFTSQFKALELSYKGGELSMWLFLPRKEHTVADLLDALQESSMAEIDRSKEQIWDVIVKLPKFKLTWGTKDLKTALSSLGLVDLFDPVRANLHLLGKPLSPGGNLYVSGIYHKTFIEVNEKGSEAAAATAVAVDELAGVAEPRHFYCDRPFVFIIVENKTKTPLFIGVVERP